MKFFRFIFSLSVLVASINAQQVQLSHPIAASNERPSVLTSKLPDTVRILAVMVEFQTDNDTRTTGDGKFGSVYKQDFGKNILDPLPHNRAHFENHLKFLQNYIYKVSSVKTSVTFDVLDSIITAPKEMSAYSPRKNETNARLADFTVDAWTLVDKKFPNLDFSKYHFFMIFHAGIGRDVNVASLQGFTPNPFDLPSLYVGLNSFRQFYGSSYKGIPVKNGAQFITNSAIIPSTESRVVPSLFGGDVLLNLTTNGLLAASFGSYAGLPDLFDTKTGNTGIGRFGLMDGQSIFSYGGICPPEPSAWEKQFLGWAEPRNAESGRKQYFFTAHRTDQLTNSDILRVSVTSSEYWLLENRQRDPAGDGQEVTFMSDGQTVKMRFPKDDKGFSSSDLSALRGVIIDVEDIDWMLPGGTVISDSNKTVQVNGGILIWHIDENIVNANLATNTVNANKRLRGVDLEQAFGPQDIGEELPSPFGTTIGEGTPLDFWFKGNISPVYKNSFGKNTFPNSRTNSDYESHITIENFSTQSIVMSCDIALGDNTIGLLPGFPVKLFDNPSAKNFIKTIQTSDLDGDSIDELFVYETGGDRLLSTHKLTSNSDTTCYGWVTKQNATGFYNVDPSISAFTYYGIFGMNNPSPRITIADIDSNGLNEILVNNSFGSVITFSTKDNNNDGKADSLNSFYRSSGDVIGLKNGFIFLSKDTLFIYKSKNLSILKLPQAQYYFAALYGDDDHIIVGSADWGKIYKIGLSDYKIIELPNSSEYRAILLQVCSGKINSNNEYDVTNAWYTNLFCGNEKVILTGFPVDLHELPLALSLADVDGDKRNDIVVTTKDQVLVYNYAGALIDHYPVQSNSRYTLAARLSNDQKVSLFNIGQNTINISNDRGKSIDGFPIQTANNPEAVLFPIGKENKTLGIALIGDDGYLYAYNLKVPVNNRTFVWRSRYHDERNTNCLTEEVSSDIPFSEFFPESRCYNWPNPTYTAYTKIRYYVSKDAVITVKIYDLAGEKVDELHAKAVGGTDNEIGWNVTDVQSGVYLAHVEATAGGETGTKIIKIAIVK